MIAPEGVLGVGRERWAFVPTICQIAVKWALVKSEVGHGTFHVFLRMKCQPLLCVILPACCGICTQDSVSVPFNGELFNMNGNLSMFAKNSINSEAMCLMFYILCTAGPGVCRAVSNRIPEGR